MRKIILSSILLLSTTLPSVAEESYFLWPNEQGGYRPNYAVAAIFGSTQFDKNTDYSGDMAGIELSMNSPWIEALEHQIIDQFSLKQYAHHGDTLVTFAANPHYMFDFQDQFQLGAGPSLQLSYLDSDTSSKDLLLRMGIGGSLKKMFTDKIFFDLEMDYTIAAAESDFNSFEFLWKVGYVLGDDLLD